MISRRHLLQKGGLGLSGACLWPAASWAGLAGPYTGGKAHALNVIDGLCIPLDLGKPEPVSLKTRLAIRNCGLTAVNMTTPRPGDSYKKTVNNINKLKYNINVNTTILKLVLTAADLDSCRREGKLGIIIGFQSTEMFEGRLNAVEELAAAGMRIAQVSYNGAGLLGNGCLAPSDGGLTETGRHAIGRFNRSGVLIDVSHANKATTAESIALSDGPLVISHTGCNAVYRHPRNNDDEELRALADKGGVVGIYLMPFLDGGTGELTVEMFFAHLDYALEVCGSEHVGIGSDQGLVPIEDGPEYRARLRAEVQRRRMAGISAPGESPDRPPFIPALNRSDRLLAIADLMVARGYSAAVIEAVIGGNFYRVMRQAWG